MINMRKLKIYEDYKGDLDLWIRTRRENEKALIQTEDWYLIDVLLEDATVLQRSTDKGAVEMEAMRRLQENSENEEVVAEIQRLAEKI